MVELQARAVTSSALLSIKSALDSTESPEDFLAEVDAILGQSSSVLELPFETERPDPLEVETAGGVARDVTNGPLVYEFLGSLDPANASDTRLWTYLAFVTYRDYMERRWALDSVKNWKQRVDSRWLMLNASRGKLVRHGIARLWWVSSLTYDPKCEQPLSKATGDPFAYTRAVLQNEDRVLGLFDREVGALGQVVRAVLEYAAVAGGRATGTHIRALMKELTLVYGYRDLAALEPRVLAEVVEESAAMGQ